MANNFIKFKGKNIGKSLVEKGSYEVIKKIYYLSENNNCEVIYTFRFCSIRKISMKKKTLSM